MISCLDVSAFKGGANVSFEGQKRNWLMSQAASYAPATSHGLVHSGLVSPPPKFVLDPIFAWISYYDECSRLKMSHRYGY